MDFWKVLKIAGIVALVVVLGSLWLADGSDKQHSTPAATSSDDASGFGSLK